MNNTNVKKMFLGWLRARRMVFLYALVLFACFFVVYALYGYLWRVAGYAALLALAAGLGLAVWDFSRFAAQYSALARLAGRFPTGDLPSGNNILEVEYLDIIAKLESERARLAQEGEDGRRDAEEYYMLWAHQIKTPIAAMQLLLQSGGEEGLSAHETAAARQELWRIGQYVGMVLQYQRLSSMEGDLRLEKLELAALVNGAAKNCAPLFIHKGLGLSTGEVTGSLVTDKKWFCFVLEQLFTNAAKYTPGATAEAPAGQVRVYMKDAETLAVADTGIGIAAEDLPRVFERGFTGAVGRSERSSTGIGLYLCRRILARLGFGISIESTPGAGTTVLLHLRQQALEME